MLNPCEVEIIIAALKRHEAPGRIQIPAERIHAGGETLRSEIHTLFISIWNEEKLP
jgi:hypothetical protein